MKLFNFLHITKRLLIGLRTRFRVLLFGMYSPKWYPGEVYSFYKLIKSDSSLKHTNLDCYSCLNKLRLSSKKDTDPSINLLGVNILFNDFSKIWEGSSKIDRVDSELINASHRFHWILEAIAENEDTNQVNEILSIVEEWKDWARNNKLTVAYQPYNISERISNLTVFYFILINNELVGSKELSQMQDFLNNELIILKDCLEYPASNIINNHVLNNARALYLGGHFVGRQSLVQLSESIFRLHLPKMIDSDGFLIEGSSHYHLLLTRSLTEVLNISNCRNDNKKFSIFIGKFANRMYQACFKLVPNNLIDKAEYPSIGDISPDIKFTWFNPNNNKIEGWNKIWTTPFDEEIISISQDMEGEWSVLNDKDWFCVNFVNTNSQTYPIGHSHRDFGSFVLYHKGQQIFTDVGRYSYDQVDCLDYSGEEGYAHSGIFLDKLHSKEVELGFFSSLLVNEERGFQKTNTNFKWFYSSRKNKWARECKAISNDSFLVEDFVKAEQIHGFFYLSTNTKVVDQGNEKVKISVGNRSYSINFTNVEDLFIESVNTFPSYGVIQPSKRVSWFSSCPPEGENIKIKIKEL